MERTPDQIQFTESFTQERDTLTLEVGLLRTEKDSLLIDNKELSASNSALQQSIDNIHTTSAKIAFDESEKINALRLECSALEEEIKHLNTTKKSLSDDIAEKNNTILTLGVLVNSIQTSTSDTVTHIRSLGNELNTYTNRVKESSEAIGGESVRVKSFVDELGGVVDRERKDVFERNRVLDNREIALINREKLVDMRYKGLTK